MNPRDVFNMKEDGLEKALPSYEEELKIPINIQGTNYPVKIKEYENLMHILTETGAKLDEMKHYDSKCGDNKYFGIKIEDYSITKLQINHYQLRKMPYLKELSQLRTLNLRKNLIKKIEGLEYLNKLEFVNLNFNNISIMEGFEKLSNLKRIVLIDNLIYENEENIKLIKELKKKEVRILI